MTCTSEDTLFKEIANVLGEAQGSVEEHERLLKTLIGLHEKTEGEMFCEAFFQSLKNLLVVYKRAPAAERVVKFVASFVVSTAPKQENSDGSACSDDETSSNNSELAEGSFFSLLIQKLLSIHGAQWKGIRFRVCQLLAKLLTLASDTNTIVPSRLYDMIQNSMLERVLDKIPIVRVHAVAALELLQQPTEDECPVTSAFLSLLNTDPSSEVRHCALHKIGVNDHTFLSIIERTRDVKEVIRRDAFLKLAESCSIKHFRIHQRIQLLSDGLKDDSSEVVDACVNGLLRNWSLELDDGDLIALLSRLDVESSPEVCALAISKVFESLSVDELVSTMEILINSTHNGEDGDNDNSMDTSQGTDKPGSTTGHKVIAMHRIGAEEAFYWLQLCLYLRDNNADEAIERILPTTSEFCDYLHMYVEQVVVTHSFESEDSLESQFVFQQLCAMLPVLDQSDEVGRRKLGTMICDILRNISFPTPLIKYLMSQQTKLWPQESHREDIIAKVISDISQDENEEQSLILLRCLTIAAELLRELRPQILSHSLVTLKESLVLPCVQNVDPYVRDMAVFCLGLLSILDVKAARTYLLLFIQVSQVDHEAVQATALKIVFDLLHVYGFEMFNIVAQEGDPEMDESAVEKPDPVDHSSDETKPGNTMQRLVNIMVNALEGESLLLSQVSAEGLAKLLLSKRLTSQKLLAKLLIMWYNPLVQDDNQLISILGTFFSAYANSDRSCAENLSEVYLPVVTSVLEAPPTSPLYKIDVSNVADFVIHLTEPKKPEDECVHDNLAFAVCNAVLSNPSSSDVRVHCRSLSLLSFSPLNKNNAASLFELYQLMVQEVKDKTSLRYLNKFGDNLRLVNPSCEVTNQSPNPSEPMDTEPLAESNENTVIAQSVKKSKPRAKTTMKKPPPPNRPATKKAAKKGKKVDDQSSEDDVGSENVYPVPATVSLPTRVMSARVSKTVAVTRMRKKDIEVKKLVYSSDSDDSLIGEHSPFIRRAAQQATKSGCDDDVAQALDFEQNVDY